MRPFITNEEFRNKVPLQYRIATVIILWVFTLIISIVLAIFLPIFFLYFMELLYNESYDILELTQIMGIIVTPILLAIIFMKWIWDEIKYERKKNG